MKKLFIILIVMFFSSTTFSNPVKIPHGEIEKKLKTVELIVKERKCEPAEAIGIVFGITDLRIKYGLALDYLNYIDIQEAITDCQKFIKEVKITAAYDLSKYEPGTENYKTIKEAKELLVRITDLLDKATKNKKEVLENISKTLEKI